MKSIFFTTILASLTAINAMPSSYSSLDERQLQTTSNDVKDGVCKDVTFIMARGSTEIGNMVSSNYQHPLAPVWPDGSPG